MALLYVFFIVSTVFAIGLCYSLYANKYKSMDVNIFECGIKKDADESEANPSYLDTFPLVTFLCIDIVFLFLICFAVDFKNLDYSGYINLLVIISLPILGVLYFLRRN